MYESSLKFQWDLSWFIVLVLVFCLMCMWLHFWLSAYNSYDNLNWYVVIFISRIALQSMDIFIICITKNYFFSIDQLRCIRTIGWTLLSMGIVQRILSVKHIKQTKLQPTHGAPHTTTRSPTKKAQIVLIFGS